MLRVALTGGIATGKSYVAARLRARGVPVIESDRLVHDALRPGTSVSAQIIDRFGTAILTAEGEIDRRRVAAIVFADSAARQDLERIVHPIVYEAITRWFEEQDRAGVKWAVADIPLLYETGRAGDFDRTIVTACGPAQQTRRLIERDGLSEDQARARLAAQWPIEEKVRLADIVIRTDGTFAETDRQVDAAWSELNREAARGRKESGPS